ncbi:MAG: metallophosphoesterase [Lachnospiraceae bacterium]|nr:metallophosphoesterase [Lachnospiraceae bacterium]
MWIAILTTALLFAAVSAVYLATCFGRFGVVRKLSGGRRWLRILLGTVPLLGFVVYGLFDTVNSVIILLHLAAAFLVADLITMIVRRFRRRKKNDKTANDNNSTTVEQKSGENPRIYYAGIAAILLCAVYLMIGWYLAHHVFRTQYTIETAKNLPDGKLRVALIADSHIGTTFDGEEFGTYIDRISGENPGILVVVGDFVDDSTSREDMIAACAALGRAKTGYGVYFVFGNHDKGYYNTRPFTAEQRREALEKNGVTVMEDDIMTVTDGAVSFHIIGRRDRDDASRAKRAGVSSGDRAKVSDLIAAANPDEYIIILDHQPHDYDEESKAGADLVLSGHTHGGQLFPLAPVGYLSGANEQIYGMKKRGDHTVSIVTSGISDWAIDYKTGTFSEYVIIDIRTK